MIYRLFKSNSFYLIIDMKDKINIFSNTKGFEDITNKNIKNENKQIFIENLYINRYFFIHSITKDIENIIFYNCKIDINNIIEENEYGIQYNYEFKNCMTGV